MFINSRLAETGFARRSAIPESTVEAIARSLDEKNTKIRELEDFYYHHNRWMISWRSGVFTKRMEEVGNTPYIAGIHAAFRDKRYELRCSPAIAQGLYDSKIDPKQGGSWRAWKKAIKDDGNCHLIMSKRVYTIPGDNEKQHREAWWFLCGFWDALSTLIKASKKDYRVAIFGRGMTLIEWDEWDQPRSDA